MSSFCFHEELKQPNHLQFSPVRIRQVKYLEAINALWTHKSVSEWVRCLDCRHQIKLLLQHPADFLWFISHGDCFSCVFFSCLRRARAEAAVRKCVHRRAEASAAVWREALSACPPRPLQPNYSGDDVRYVQPVKLSFHYFLMYCCKSLKM